MKKSDWAAARVKGLDPGDPNDTSNLATMKIQFELVLLAGYAKYNKLLLLLLLGINIIILVLSCCATTQPQLFR